MPPTTASRLYAQDQGEKVRNAVLDSNLTAVKRLAISPALANSPSPEGITPLMMAAALGYTDIMTQLLEAGADVQAVVDPSTSGLTALMFAADGGQLKAVQLLIEHGANIDATDRGGNTALDYAQFNISDEGKEGRKQVAAYLKEKGAAELRSANDSFRAMSQRSNPSAAIRQFKAKRQRP
jgi:ankyrin repeat protein